MQVCYGTSGWGYFFHGSTAGVRGMHGANIGPHVGACFFKVQAPG
jgi:hypothetical protein